VLAVAALAVGTLGWLWAVRAPADPLAEGRSAYRRGEYAAAADAARARLRERKEDREALRLLARASARLGRADAALGMFGRLGEDALEAEDLYLVSTQLAGLGRPEAASAVLEKALTLDPDHPDALVDRARWLATTDALARAADLALRLAALPGQGARGQALLGRIREIEGDHRGAAEAFARALELDPELTNAPPGPGEVRKHLARDQLALGEPDAALATLALAPDDRESRWLRSRALLLAGRVAEAAEALPAAEGFGREQPPLAPDPAPYAGAERCAECHRDIARSQQSSHHATTFHRGAGIGDLPLPDAPLPDPAAPAVEHAFPPAGDGRFAFTASRGDESARALIEFAFGSGDRGATPVGREPSGQYRELRLSHYGDGSGWDVTTGHPRDLPASAEIARYLGEPLDDDALRRCLECHTTEPFRARHAVGPAARDHAIGCERCHGPGGAHVAAMRAAPDYPEVAIARPRLATGPQATALCGQCHSPKGMTVRRDDPTAIRFQGTTLPWSRCYTESRGALSCTTCHDPHRDAETSPGYYDAKCLACHTPGGPAPPAHAEADGARPLTLDDAMPRTPCTVSPSEGCVGCHMPARENVLPHTRFTDHFIRVHPVGEAAPGGM
jgi:tetratricopeptide (TPR) repeat protein